MKTTQHTPGEWTAKGCKVVATFHKSSSPFSFNICEAVWGQDGKEAEANARLIAAAPELLEALKKLHDEAGQIKGYWAGHGQSVERLIAKVEGA